MGAVQVSSAMMPFVGRGFHSIYKHIPRDPAGFNVLYEANYEAYFEKIYLSQLFGHLLMWPIRQFIDYIRKQIDSPVTK